MRAMGISSSEKFISLIIIVTYIRTHIFQREREFPIKQVSRAAALVELLHVPQDVYQREDGKQVGK